ncbi:hypothetical protein MSG_02815 [Mycobacterium shigaense]|uniref:Uncharacterized protein n=4 Tax=Mycobacterium shigaense TaxID=722731 RepID=A0A1Z4EIZ5_9MYCO|nr:universal stress protein [Mycobacterium shigaense]PRI13813.1 hypothetical protein B2J96_19430 [Mycobacterium shigaense]BAX92959.1 hypothetical protein MSG_02815 [Mycobacterium shigaense]
MLDRYPPKSVIVGIDGSQAAIRAARWAVPEVAGTDIPLRLIYVTPACSTEHSGARAALMASEEVVHGACSAVDEMGESLKLEAEIFDGRPVPALIAASRFATLLCVGDKGAAQHPDDWLGSTARELARSAHCSVAIVRGSGAARSGARCILARVDESPDDLDVLDFAVDEALRRQAPLRVLTTAQSSGRGGHGDRTNRGALDVLLQRLRNDYPEVEIGIEPLAGSFLGYVCAHAATTQLIMISSARAGEVQQLLGPDGGQALRASDCSLLVVGLERLARQP